MCARARMRSEKCCRARAAHDNALLVVRCHAAANTRCQMHTYEVLRVGYVIAPAEDNIGDHNHDRPAQRIRSGRYAAVHARHTPMRRE